jgi:hypothetical protein
MKSPRWIRVWRGLFLCAALPLSGCALLDQALTSTGITPPTVTLQSVTLAESPSQAALAAYYCPRVVAEATGVSFGVDLACQGFFGPSPPESSLLFGFDVHFNVANGNRVPLPLSEILTAVNVFPETNRQNLGAVCLHLCAPEDPACQGGPSATGCQSSSKDIRSLGDFVGAAANLLIAKGIADASGRPLPLVAPKVLASSSLEVTTRFSLAPTVVLPVLQELARQSVSQLQTGKLPVFAIPYKLEGTVFVDAGSLGRVAAGYGPFGGEWVLPTETLVR